MAERRLGDQLIFQLKSVFPSLKGYKGANLRVGFFGVGNPRSISYNMLTSEPANIVRYSTRSNRLNMHVRLRDEY